MPNVSERDRMKQAWRASERRYRVVVETANDAIITIDERDIITYANPGEKKIFGHHPTQLRGQNLAILLPPQPLPGKWIAAGDHDEETHVRRSWDGGDVSAIHKSGREILLEISVAEFQDEGHSFFTGIMRDVTHHRQAEILCSSQNQLLEQIATGRSLPKILDALVRMIESQCDGMLGSILLLDADGVHLRHGAAPHIPATFMVAIDGLSIGPQVGSCGTAMYYNKPVIVADILRDPLWADYCTLASQCGLRACWSIPIRSHDGKVLGSFAMYYTEVRSPTSEELRLAALGSHIAGIAIERQRTEDYISHLAHHDALTGLPNRTLLQAVLSQAVVQARRHKSAVAVLYIDLDNFKIVNDSHGHHIGDCLLKTVAERLRACVREEDQVARLAGDEFMIILPTPRQSEEAASVATKVLEVLLHPFLAEGHELHAGASIGISLYPNDGETAGSLMQAADTAMYHAKQKGGGNYQFFSQHLNVAIQHRLTTESLLRHALAYEELTLHYQPQVDMKSKRIFAAEALIRWRHPERGLICPSEFIAIAEDTGLLVPIGEWALREACRQLKRWHDAGHTDLKMAVNMSARQIAQPGMIATVAEVLKETELTAESLSLEMTESTLTQPDEKLLNVLRGLKEMGIQLSVDHFGHGNFSMSYLQQFLIHTLKIDQAFMHGMDRDQTDITIADGVIAMARSLHLEVIAEGVETDEQASFLESHGCLSAQGYFYGKPVTSDAFAALI